MSTDTAFAHSTTATNAETTGAPEAPTVHEGRVLSASELTGALPVVRLDARPAWFRLAMLPPQFAALAVAGAVTAALLAASLVPLGVLWGTQSPKRAGIGSAGATALGLLWMAAHR